MLPVRALLVGEKGSQCRGTHYVLWAVLLAWQCFAYSLQGSESHVLA